MSRTNVLSPARDGRDVVGYARTVSEDVDGRPSDARARLLATASQIFYTEGINSVGIDRIVTEANVTRATLYRHIASKDNLVTAYLNEASRTMRADVDAITAVERPADDAIRAVAEDIAAGIGSSHFHGCAFLNAAAEFPAAAHPVRQAVVAHRSWFLSTMTSLFADALKRPASEEGRHFVMLRDGAMAAGCLGEANVACETFLRAVEGLLVRGPDDSTVGAYQ
jgi:AcrR family transcriptional regulator